MPTISGYGPTHCVPTTCTPGRVQDDLTMALRQHGFSSPLRGLADPRLDHPDLLIVGGWDRVEYDDGYGYRRVADENPATREKWEQYFEVRSDRAVLVTQAGLRVQTITESGDGRVNSSIGLAD